MDLTTLLATLTITLGLGLISGAALELFRLQRVVAPGGRRRSWTALRHAVLLTVLVSLGTLPVILVGALGRELTQLLLAAVSLLGAGVALAVTRAAGQLARRPEPRVNAAKDPQVAAARDNADDEDDTEDDTEDGAADDDAEVDAGRPAPGKRDAAPAEEHAPRPRSPANDASLRRIAASRPGLVADDSSSSPGEPLRVDPGRVLVVDDSSVNRTVLRRHLERLGHESTLCIDGQQALDMLSRDPHFDVVLLDLVMPNVDGFEVLSRLKASTRTSDIPVLIISSVQDGEQVARCIEAGADDFLPKPFNPSLLRARIETCLVKRRLRARERRFILRLDRERRRSDELLRVILPDSIAEELRTAGSVRPRKHERVAVLFADIVGFTAYCEHKPPEEVLKPLQRVISAFETLTARHGVQKIKTIGDSFMAACGLRDDDHEDEVVSRCVELGLDMLRVVRQNSQWQLRIGVHVGPVVAGIVGERQYLYDIWGDTVNTASRIESHGVTGRVCVSRGAWHELAGRFAGRSLGPVEVKGKGQLEIFEIDPEPSQRTRPARDETADGAARAVA